MESQSKSFPFYMPEIEPDASTENNNPIDNPLYFDNQTNEFFKIIKEPKNTAPKLLSKNTNKVIYKL